VGVGVIVGVGVGVGVGVMVGVGVGVEQPTPALATSTVLMSAETPSYPPTITSRFPTAAPFVHEWATFMLGPVDHVLPAMS